MDHNLHNLARRGLEMAREQEKLKVPTWGLHVLGATVVAYFIVAMLISYTYNHLVATLAIIETPTAIPIIQTSPKEDRKDSDDPDAPLLSPEEKVAYSDCIEEELLLVKQKPITSHLRTTIRHLRSRGGFLSRFRGFQLLALNVFVMYILTVAASFVVADSLPFTIIATTGFNVVLARLNTAWVHSMISEPSSKSLAQRIPPRSAFKKLAGPAALVAIVQQLSIYVPAQMYYGLGLNGYVHNPFVFKHMSKMQVTSVCLATALLISVTVLLSVAVCFPVHVAYTRLQASLLPEDDEPIVPFDRTFGGKVVPAIIGGSGMIGMRDAWKTFDWNAIVRVVKVYVKTAFMQMALFMLFLVAVAVELRLILGPQLDRIIRDGMRKGHDEPDLEIVVD